MQFEAASGAAPAAGGWFLIRKVRIKRGWTVPEYEARILREADAAKGVGVVGACSAARAVLLTPGACIGVRKAAA